MPLSKMVSNISMFQGIILKSEISVLRQHSVEHANSVQKEGLETGTVLLRDNIATY